MTTMAAGRPALLLGRPAAAAATKGRIGSGGGSYGNPGRQSPLLILTKNSHSPAVTKRRRVGGAAAKKPGMRKSMSLDDVQVGAGPVHTQLLPDLDTQQNFLPQHIEEKEDIAISAKESAESSVSDVALAAPPPPPPGGRVSPVQAGQVFSETARTVVADKSARPLRSDLRSSSYTSLPRPVSRSKSISRSLVPRMRRMFEKSRSCDPDMAAAAGDEPQVPEAGADTRHDLYLHRQLPAAAVARDGTESTRSSFVLLGPSAAGGPPPPPSATPPPPLESDPAAADRKSRGFVNKCVTKVKSFIGKSDERD